MQSFTKISLTIFYTKECSISQPSCISYYKKGKSRAFSASVSNLYTLELRTTESLEK